jgi:hypothetical protein
MEIVRNEVVSGETIVMDDKHFVACKYSECKLIYSGGECQWTESTFERCQIVLSGPAQRTANLLVGFGAIPPSGTNLPPGVIPTPKKPDGKVH